jgi:hypothetical protein
MGPAISRTWFIYGRDYENAWLKKPIYSTLYNENNIRYHAGQFKHHVYIIALGLNHYEVSKIFLYWGWRQIKCENDNFNLKITFSNKKALKAWQECNRSYLGKSFDKLWIPICTTGFIHHFKKKSRQPIR